MLCVAGAFLATSAQAQLSLQRQKYDQLAREHKGDPAIYTDCSEKLVISEDGGQLQANSYTTIEKLFLTQMSLNQYNRDFFSYGYFADLTNYNGTVRTPSGNDYKKTETVAFGEAGHDDYIFFDDSRRVVAYYTGLAKNSVTTTTYSLEHPDLNMLPRFFFTNGLPTVHASFQVVAPDYVEMRFVIKGLDTSMIKRTREERNGSVIYTFTAENVPAWKEYSHVPSARYYLPHIIPYIASYRLTGANRDSMLTANPDLLYKYVYRYVHDMNMKLDPSIGDKVAELTKGDRTDKEKAQHIYSWVQHNMHYVAIENGLEGFIPRPADTVYKRKYGDCKDMSSLLVAMCRKAGLEAHFTWIGSDNIPYTHAEVPLSCMYDHMICAVKINGEWVFLDGTDQFLPYGANRVDLQGKEAMIAIDAKNYQIVKIPVAPATRSMLTDSTTINIVQGDISGDISQSYNGYNAWDLQHYLTMSNSDDKKDKLVRSLTERGTDKFKPGKYDVEADDEGDLGVDIRTPYRIGDYVQQAGKMSFVNMNLTRRFADNRIDDSTRPVPVYNEHKGIVRETVVLNVPDGYKVASVPAATKGGDGSLWSYSISYKNDVKNKKVILTKEYTVNAMVISPAQFEYNNALVDKLRKEYKETVILTRK